MIILYRNLAMEITVVAFLAFVAVMLCQLQPPKRR